MHSSSMPTTSFQLLAACSLTTLLTDHLPGTCTHSQVLREHVFIWAAQLYHKFVMVISVLLLKWHTEPFWVGLIPSTRQYMSCYYSTAKALIVTSTSLLQTTAQFPVHWICEQSLRSRSSSIRALSTKFFLGLHHTIPGTLWGPSIVHSRGWDGEWDQRYTHHLTPWWEMYEIDPCWFLPLPSSTQPCAAITRGKPC